MEMWGFNVVSLMLTLEKLEVFMWFPLFLPWETRVSLWFPSCFALGNMGFPCSFHLNSMQGNPGNRSVGCFLSGETTWNLRVSRVETRRKHGGNLVFPSGFRVVSWLGTSLFSPSAMYFTFTMLFNGCSVDRWLLCQSRRFTQSRFHHC